jgi:hypothetical protein
MSYARQMLGTVPRDVKVEANADALAAAIDALQECAQACSADIDADLSEPNLTEMVACIRLCQDCVDVCTAAAAVLSRPAAPDARVVQALLDASVAACAGCGAECQRHAAMHEHCRVCAEACLRCELACRNLIDVMK